MGGGWGLTEHVVCRSRGIRGSLGCIRRCRVRGPLSGVVWEKRGVERREEPAWMWALITQPNTLSGLSSRRKGPEVSAGAERSLQRVPHPDGAQHSPTPACHHAGQPLAHRALLTEAGLAPGPVPMAVVPFVCPGALLHVSGTLLGSLPPKIWPGRGLPRSQSWWPILRRRALHPKSTSTFRSPRPLAWRLGFPWCQASLPKEDSFGPRPRAVTSHLVPGLGAGQLAVGGGHLGPAVHSQGRPPPHTLRCFHRVGS